MQQGQLCLAPRSGHRHLVLGAEPKLKDCGREEHTRQKIFTISAFPNFKPPKSPLPLWGFQFLLGANLMSLQNSGVKS